ncbi:TetR family transcriptional regulator [[Actinomadura] parvosata subsp. kistnae]|uniref:TetR family transcriptional regulator n=1 Tax=[Actinomadura] parvosata subsp. kistnae TaxID=1909395 RepID=A0A1U9ZTG9_9ACTN|nr:TetR/AcrR family transcriptional regulator [Nonomuraea sp. ATCC 55076]AQZ61219.1 TetR family transcriptional regulator [Nonomuraea sp. ATCC 55076]
MSSAPMSGRKAQAARNDELILQAARAVFTAEPGAPIAAVAEKAGVGISALYRRYPSKEALLQKLCGDGLRLYIEVSERSLADDGDPWEAFASYLRGIVDADSSSLTIKLAGTFTPTEELGKLAARASSLATEVHARAIAAGVLRPDVTTADIALLFEQLASIKLGDEERVAQLRHRYLTLMMDALRVPPARRDLPGPEPRDEELAARWRPRD